IRKGVAAKKIDKEQEYYRIVLADQTELKADFIVLSTVHTVAQTLLQDERLNQGFNQLKNNSLISVYLGFDLPDSLLPQNGTGFISTNSEDIVCNACTWMSK